MVSRLSAVFGLCLLFFFGGLSQARAQSVIISSPLNGSTVSNPVSIAARANTTAAVSAVQVYDNGTLKYTSAGNTMSTLLTFTAGAHQLAFKYWVNGSPSSLSIINITVSSTTSPSPSGSSVIVSSPTNGATLASPVQISAKANTTTTVSSIQVYDNGSLASSVNGNTMNVSLNFSAGAHRLDFKYWLNGSPSALTTVNITVSSTAPAPSPSPIATGGGGTSPNPIPSNAKYVSTSGSDSNSGSASSPWRTIQHAANVASPGDTIVVENGTYVETVSITRGGTASSPIVFRSHYKWGAKIAPTSTSGNGNYSVTFSGVSYVTLQDFEITATSTTDSAVKFYLGAPHNRVIGNNIHNVGVSTTTCTSGAGVLVADNYEDVIGNRIWNIGPPRSVSFRCNQQHGIYVTSGSGGRLQNNLIFDVWQGLAFHLTGIGLSNWTITNNTVFNGGDNRTSFAQSPDGGGFILDCLGGTCDYNNVSNNIFAYMQNAIIYEVNDGGTVGSHNVYSNNLLYNNSASNTFVTGHLVNTVSVSPLFVNYTGDQNGDYRITSSSPAVNAGTSAGAPSIDFNGYGRPYSGAFDIGAYEYHP